MNEFVKKLTPDYLDDVLIRLAHHSSAMEGNTITLPETATIIDVVKAILESHIIFEKIHPFSDGNGRTGRMVMNYSLLENGLPPLIIDKENKGLYNKILHEAQLKSFPAEEDIEMFYELIHPFLQNEKKRIESFLYKEKNQMIGYDGIEKESKSKKSQKNELER